MNSPLEIPFTYDFFPASTAYVDADGAASPGGYSSDGGHSEGGYLSNGDISSIYGAYSRNKTRKRKRWTSPPQAVRQTRVTRTRIHHSSPPSVVHKLPSNVLFDIFTFYGANVFSEPGGHKYWWQTLALVCSKWNSVIRTWPSHFLGELRFGNNDSTLFFQNISHQRGISATHSLKRSPLLPLNLNYDLIRPSVQSSKGDEDDIIVLLQHLERVHSLQLRLPPSTWRLIALAAATSGMPVSCTCIEHIYFDTGDRATGFVLPNVFLKGHSPRLRTLIMIGVFPPSLSSLLLSPTRLTCLVLDGIPDPSHLPPRELLMHLRNMPQLQYLNIGFLSTTPHRCLAGDVSSLGRVALPFLKRFYFRGVCAYLESLVTNLDAATVSELVFTFFHQLKYIIPHISSFLRRTKRFGFDGIRINFWPDGLVIAATPAITSSPKDILCLRFPCARLDFQVASAAQICRALGPNFGNMEDLFVKYHQDQLPTQWHGEVDPSLWRELLLQFRGMKTLWISSALVSEVTASLGYDTLSLLEASPILAWIIVEIHRDDTSIAAAHSLSELLAGVRSLGGPVIDVYQLLSDKWKTGTLPRM